jgi:hypothetical protein
VFVPTLCRKKGYAVQFAALDRLGNQDSNYLPMRLTGEPGVAGAATRRISLIPSGLHKSLDE